MTFENRYLISREMYWEFVNKVLCRGLNLLTAAFAVIAALTLLIGLQRSPRLAAVSGLCLLFFLFLRLYYPKIMLKKYIELQNNLHGGQHPETVIVFDESIHMTEGNQSLTIEYAQIAKIYRLNTLSVLMFTGQNGVPYSESGFTAGSAADFEKFILEKCPQVKQIERR